MSLSFLLAALPLAFLVASITTAVVLASRHRNTFLPAAASPSVVGLVIAHPDDECMFFTPTLVHLKASGHALHILCLSSGNADGLGRVRAKELAASAKLLGVDSITLIDDERQLADGLRTQWSAEVIQRHVAAFTQARRVDTLLTFDDGGISGHPNHIDTYRGVRAFLSAQHRDGVVGYSLLSTPIWRKYAGLADGALSFGEDALRAMFSRPADRIHFVSLLQPGLVHRCMAAHASQLVWYRRLFIIFSRYTYLNTLRMVPL